MALGLEPFFSLLPPAVTHIKVAIITIIKLISEIRPDIINLLIHLFIQLLVAVDLFMSLQNSCIEALTPNVTVFAKGDYK